MHWQCTEQCGQSISCIVCREFSSRYLQSFLNALTLPIAPQAREELAKLGPMSTDEKLTAFAFAVTVGLWIFGGAIGVNAVAAALTGLAILLITGAQS